MKGGCYCGALRYEVTADPVMKAQCHCRECQYITGGGPNFFMIVPSDGYVFTQGAPAAYERSDIAGPRLRQFCATCGTHMTTLIRERGMTVVKIGTLDDPAADYGGPDCAIFMKDSQPYHTTAEGLACFQDLPPRP